MPQQDDAPQKTGFLYGRLSRGETRREEEHYGLTPESRRARVGAIIGVLRRTGAFKGEMTPAKLRGVLEALGPTFVKVGQIRLHALRDLAQRLLR